VIDTILQLFNYALQLDNGPFSLFMHMEVKVTLNLQTFLVAKFHY